MSANERRGVEINENEQVGGILPLCTAICLRRSIENAMFNSHSKEYIPLEIERIVAPCAKFMHWANLNPLDIPKALTEIHKKHVDYNNTNTLTKIKK